MKKASKINVLCRVKVIGVLKRNFMQIRYVKNYKCIKDNLLMIFMMKLCKHWDTRKLPNIWPIFHPFFRFPARIRNILEQWKFDDLWTFPSPHSHNRTMRIMRKFSVCSVEITCGFCLFGLVYELCRRGLLGSWIMAGLKDFCEVEIAG